MPSTDQLQFEMQRRVILFNSGTTMPDNTVLGYEGNPNYASTATDGQTLLYNSPRGTHYIELVNGNLWYKQQIPNTWINLTSGTQSGTAGTSSQNNVVFVTGNQTISGIKTFDVFPIVSGNKLITGVDLSSYLTSFSASSTYSTITNLASTGSTLDTKINNLSGYVTGTNATFASVTNLANTGSNLDTKINNLSGYLTGITGTFGTSVNSLNANAVFITGNQIISGIKTFASRPTVNSTGILFSGEAAPKDIGTTINISSNTISLDLSTFSYFLVNLNNNITTTNFNNPKAAPEVTNFVLQLSGDGTIRSVTWPTSLRWPGSTAPIITIGPNKVDTYSIFSYDGGVSYYGFPAGYNS